MSIQNIKFNTENKHSFIALAKEAALLEASGLWDEARMHWGIARKVARKSENKQWAQDRADYCLQAAHRNWKVAA